MRGACLVGAGAELVTVEARFEPIERERTEIAITGLPDVVIRESRARVVSALEENGLGLRPGKLFLNLVPAARRKSGETLDLPLALAAAAAVGHLEPRWLGRSLFLGGLGIDGRLHPVPGGLAAAAAAREHGIATLIAPGATAREAACLPEVEALGARHLAQLVAHLSGAGPRLVAARAPQEDELGPPPSRAGLDEVRGQASAKLALAVAAAGGHGLLMVGPPGAGKSMLARRMLGLLPPLELEERLELTRVLSAVGRWPRGLARERPFRAPHHSASTAGVVGGGPAATPGEVTLAHKGLLFLDELPEFRRETLESLRQPLESGLVAISRARERVELPADFQLVCAMNPCPCGWRGHPTATCACPPSAVERYRRRVSGALLDRIDLRLELAAPRVAELAAGGPARAAEPGEAELRERAAAARRLARERNGGRPNAALDTDALDRVAPLDPAAVALLERAARRRGLSARAVQSLRRVARTLADFDERERVAQEHLSRALALRAPWP